MQYLFIFLAWTLMIYLSHRLAHTKWIKWYYNLHEEHHNQIIHDSNKKFHWTNLFLYIDSWKGTLDQWIMEIIPTIIFCYIFNCWWLFVCYYLWTAFVQENIEHNPKFNLYPIITSGKWHLLHHDDPKVNFGVFVPIWDIIFKTKKDLK